MKYWEVGKLHSANNLTIIDDISHQHMWQMQKTIAKRPPTSER